MGEGLSQGLRMSSMLWTNNGSVARQSQAISQASSTHFDWKIQHAFEGLKRLQIMAGQCLV